MTRQMHDCRVAFAHALTDLAEKDKRIVALTNDAKSSSKLSAFADHLPKQFINVGIAEQNLIGIAAGLANGGKIPFVSGAACFLTGRALEQIKADIAYSNANVKLCGMSSGLAYGPLGPTQSYWLWVYLLITHHTRLILRRVCSKGRPLVKQLVVH